MYGSVLGTDNHTSTIGGSESDVNSRQHSGGIIDGRYSYGDEGYVTVEVRVALL